MNILYMYSGIINLVTGQKLKNKGPPTGSEAETRWKSQGLGLYPGIEIQHDKRVLTIIHGNFFLSHACSNGGLI